MLKGIHLTLLIGPVVPIPAPQIVVDSVSSLQVTNSKDRSGFQITFTVAKTSPLLTTMLPAGFFDPITTRLIIIITLNGFPNIIMDGLVTNQQLAPSNEVGKSNLTLTGEDLSIAMDLIQKIIPYPAQPVYTKIYTALAPYAALGITPIVIPPIIDIVKSPTEGWETQKMTDREYIKSQAQSVGYVFFVHPGPFPGQSIAYFGPDINLPVPQPALSINLDAQSNVEALSFSLNGLAKAIRIYTIYDPETNKIPIPVASAPNISPFKPPLGLKPALPFKLEFATLGANLSPAEVAQEVVGYLINNSASISGNGSLDVMRYKGLLRAHMLVGVRGAGIAYDGLYYVDSVTHNIKQGEYKQNFTLSRDGLISNTPLVNP